MGVGGDTESKFYVPNCATWETYSDFTKTPIPTALLYRNIGAWKTEWAFNSASL